MANAVYNDGVPTVAPDVTVPDRYQHIQANPDAFGAAIGRGLEKAGAGASQASENLFSDAKFWQQVQTDHSLNDVQRETHDATEDFKKLKGADALNQQKDYNARIDDIISRGRENLSSPMQKLAYDNAMRPFRERYLAGQITSHAVKEAYDHTAKVNEATISNSLGMIPNVADDPEQVKHFIGDATFAAAKQVEAQYGFDADPSIKLNALKATQAAGYKTWIEAVAVKNPARAAEMAEEYRGQLGGNYRPVAAGVRAQAEQQTGIEGGLRNAEPPTAEPIANIPAGFISGIKQSEGFAAKAAWDYKQNTNGYGTKAQSPNEVIDRATADQRFNDEIAKAAAFVDKVNPNLDPGTRAALTSLTFNAGTDWANAGLGEKVRAGELTGARELFKQYSKAGGVTNDGLVARRQREASWFGQADVAPATSKADAYERARNDPELKGKPGALQHAFGVINQHFSAQETERQTVGHLINDDQSSILSTGVPSNDLTIERVGKTLGPQAATEFSVNRGLAQNYFQQTHDWALLSAPEIQDRVQMLAPVPGEPGFDYAQRLQQHAAKTADDMVKRRYDDPAGAVEKLPEVMAAKRGVSPQDPASNITVVKARMLAQTRLGLPEGAQSPIPDDEAKRYAALLRPVSKGQADVQNQEQVIDGVVKEINKKYGPDYAQAAMARVLFHVTMKSDASDVLAAAMERYTKQEGPPLVTPDEASRVQIERDADRAAQIAGTQAPPPEAASGGGFGSAINRIGASISQAISGADAAKKKPFRQAVDLLRTNPQELMPYFVKSFGAESVPADMRQYLPAAGTQPTKPQAAANGG